MTTTPQWTAPWDNGVNWYSEEVTAPTDWLLSPSDVAEKVLRTLNDGADDDYVLHLIRAAIAAAEDHTKRCIAPRTLALVLDGFPMGEIRLPSPPLREVVSFSYVDGDGDDQSLSVSPAAYLLRGSGRYTKASLRALYGSSWPTAGTQPDAVRIVYTAGYETADAIPPDILHGIYLHIGESYKTRGLSIQPTSTSLPAPLQLGHFWKPVY